jgi:hypothetical protein
MTRLPILAITLIATLLVSTIAPTMASIAIAAPAIQPANLASQSIGLGGNNLAVLSSANKNEAFMPGMLAGGSVTVKAKSNGPDVRWILPGPRALDPAIFGTPDMPLGFDADVGLPLAARLTNADGTAYTTTAGPTPFSNNFAQIQGEFKLKAVDSTLIDGPTTEDKAKFTAKFTGPNGKEYQVKVLKVLPKGPFHPFFGGVATNIIQHGGTGIGTRLMPQVYSYVAFWGVAELTIDGSVVASNRLVHGMITNDVRDENYQLVFDDGVDNSDIQLHLILPPMIVTPTGPMPSPVPTGFTLPNGMEQPFLHIMYEDVGISPASK